MKRFTLPPVLVCISLVVLCCAATWSQTASAQTVTRIGSVATLDIGAWNVEQFAVANTTQMSNVVATMQQSGVDLWALEEVTSQAVFDLLLSRLGSDWDGRLAASSNLHNGFVFRSAMVTVRSAKLMFTPPVFEYEFAGRSPFVLDADIALPDTTVRVVFVAIHMKCCSDATSYDRRVGAASALKNRLDFLHGSDRVAVMGDFNDETARSIFAGRTSPFVDFVNDPEYTFLIPDGNVGTWCGNSSTCSTGSTIDNILITSEMEAALVPDSGKRYAELLTELPNYVNTTSDHLPVLARFSFPQATGTDREALLPDAAALQAWPIPARDFVNVELAGPAHIAVYDLLGRRVYQANQFTSGQIRLDLADLKPGVYMLQVQGPRGVRSVLVPIAH
ncbi:MAG: endonuclease/exonuclease/phosphatase family metal-dependent hydrolase [Rhodothermales bacterium]|jgi:endonuclease/exonuclease/phosphatase family metal-dependent hydrolase